MDPASLDESKVLVIYTGGTIGMLIGQHGYVPEPYFLTETLRSQSRFHDPMQDSLFSNATSVECFREWNTLSSAASSGRSSPQSLLPPSRMGPPGSHTLLVRSSRPIEVPVNSPVGLAENLWQRPVCVKVSDDVYEAHLPSLVTPRTLVPGGTTSKRIRYAILEWNPLLDSSNIETDDWIRIATEIELNYAFDAFVILHGTDTMCYTSSALSFLLEDLGKTVIMTGAQIPLSQLRSDAVDNLMGALTIAGHFLIPECSVFFNHTLFRGNRVAKCSTYDLGAFNSPNFPPLVNVGIDIVVNWGDVIRQTSLRRFRAHKKMNPHVASLRLFPGISAATIHAFLQENVRGVVLETFGAGNAPHRFDLMDALKAACDRGVVVVAISQCAKGTVSDAYETGRLLLNAGVVPGGDMTPECALAKLSYLLSKPELSIAEVRSLVSVPLRGELTPPLTGATPPLPQPSIEQNVENIQSMLQHFARLSRNKYKIVPTNSDTQLRPVSSGLSQNAQNLSALWSGTASDASAAELALLPFLIHQAAAQDDIDCMTYCLKTADKMGEARRLNTVTAGLENCLQPASKMTPLHVAAMSGSDKCVALLLRAGALVHLRDTLGHTPLYYATRQGHESTVDILIQAGAALGGNDLDGGFVKLALKTALRSNDFASISLWSKAGQTGNLKPERSRAASPSVQSEYA